MQKFTRPLTREIEMAGERLALTLDETGISLRTVGSRKPPRELSWSALICHMAVAPAEGSPTPEALAEAIQALKGGAAAKPLPKKPDSETALKPAGHAAVIPELWKRLEDWLGKHRTRYLEGLAPGAGEAALAELETVTGVPLPTDLRDWLARHNGQSHDFVGYLVESWRLLSTQEIADAKRELDPTAANTGKGWQKSWIPFLADENGDHVCLDTIQATVPVREFWMGQESHPVVAPSLADWFGEFVTAVENGAYTDDPERGVFLRNRS